MGLFDLDDYKRRKKRADLSARKPRPFPVLYADVHFNGQLQKLRFEPVLLDGGHVFISFRPEQANEAWTLVVGERREKAKGVDLYQEIVQGLTFYTDEAFQSKKWLEEAKKNVEAGHFGRLRVERVHMVPRSRRRRDDDPVFQFFSTLGIVDEEDYIEQRDIIRVDDSGGRRSKDDIVPEFAPWAPAADAHRLLTELDEDGFKAYLAKEGADPNGLYGLSMRWKELSFQQKHELLPEFEREIEAEVVSLMQAVVWSDPVFTQPNDLLPAPRYSSDERPFWRCSRFWVNSIGAAGEQHFLDERFQRRIALIWPHIGSHFAARSQALSGKEEVHPLVLSWMTCRGAYIVKFDYPNAHEHLEARLTLRDFLRGRGISLDSIDAELVATSSS